jgi:tRNA uridine 5-carboxymethylaminomethyl modification enzyme
MENKIYDILIIGGGHAGVESAYIASQFGLSVAILTLPEVGLASAPCNPSIGGVGKGQVVKELDALGGLCPILADLAGIQYRTLNESKGYAVRSTRVQIDKEAYSLFAEQYLNSIDEIDVIRDFILSIKKENDLFVVSSQESCYLGKKLIVTAGTFLNGTLHTGSKQSKGGRHNTRYSPSMNSLFSQVETLKVRFKTGTPARLNKASIDYSKLEEQPSDSATRNFSSLNSYSSRNLTQVSCYLTRTNEKTINVISENLEKSPMFNGSIKAIGARYCPSIEDKAYRYPEKSNHHVFIEPEGLNLNTVYPSGISSSLPAEIQEKFIKTIPGLENSQVELYGYAVEYDVVNTTKLDATLEYMDIPGLYFAGQVNGTSGYEEAAGQGFVAGLSASLVLRGTKPIIFSRMDSYIGVMIEDLISNLRDEPYRLFTARSENRLYIREDNAIQRMCPYRTKFGLNLERDQFNRKFIEDYLLLSDIVQKYRINSDINLMNFLLTMSRQINAKMTLSEVLKQSDLDPIQVLSEVLRFKGLRFRKEIVETVAISEKYSGYINKSIQENKKIQKLDSMKLNWEELVNSNNISFECKQRISKIRPQNFSQLKNIEGIRQATLAVVASKRV